MVTTRSTARPSKLRPFEIAAICKVVREYSGVVLGEDKAYVVQNRLDMLAQELEFPSSRDLYVHMLQSKDERTTSKIVDILLTKETSFFRHPASFQALIKEVVPELLRRSPNSTLRVWSAACSAGQEPYSISMALREAGLCQLDGRLDIYATDLSGTVLEQARMGRYSQVEVSRGLPVTLLLKYFKQNGHWWILADHVRKPVRFHQHNLLESTSSVGRFDIIFCRNVGIYFSDESKRHMISRLVASLAPGGYLFLGASESALRYSDALKHEQWENVIYYRTKDA